MSSLRAMMMPRRGFCMQKISNHHLKTHMHDFSTYVLDVYSLCRAHRGYKVKQKTHLLLGAHPAVAEIDKTNKSRDRGMGILKFRFYYFFMYCETTRSISYLLATLKILFSRITQIRLGNMGSILFSLYCQ